MNYLTNQILAKEWRHPSSIGMTYPKSEIRHKDRGSFALSPTDGFFGTVNNRCLK